VYKALCDTEDLAGYTPASVHESTECTPIVKMPTIVKMPRTELAICKVLTERTILMLCMTHIQGINSVALVRERTIPIEPPPLVSEVRAKFCG
jgi:hypothetical protein